jgi:hypothetical protein
VKCVHVSLLHVCETEEVWADHGSGSDADLSVYKRKDSYVQGMVSVAYYPEKKPFGYCLTHD